MVEMRLLWREEKNGQLLVVRLFKIYRYSWKVLADRCEAVSRLSEGTAGYDDLEIEPTNSDSCTVIICFVHFRRLLKCLII